MKVHTMDFTHGNMDLNRNLCHSVVVESRKIALLTWKIDFRINYIPQQITSSKTDLNVTSSCSQKYIVQTWEKTLYRWEFVQIIWKLLQSWRASYISNSRFLLVGLRWGGSKRSDLFAHSEGLQSRDGSAQDQGVDVMSTCRRSQPISNRWQI